MFGPRFGYGGALFVTLRLVIDRRGIEPAPGRIRDRRERRKNSLSSRDLGVGELIDKLAQMVARGHDRKAYA